MRLQEGGWTDSGKEKSLWCFQPCLICTQNDAFADTANSRIEVLGIQLPIDEVIRCYSQTWCLIKVRYTKTSVRWGELSTCRIFTQWKPQPWMETNDPVWEQNAQHEGWKSQDAKNDRLLVLRAKCWNVSCVFLHCPEYSGFFFSVTIQLHLANAKYDDSEKLWIISTY